jgi:hypothetical protein
MAFLPAVLPYLAVAGAVYAGAQKSQADKYNADVMANEQKLAVNQSVAQEGLVRRNSREQLGRQAAAFGGAGVGYSGSSEVALDQSAVNQELDALNTRYKGSVTGYGYGVESGILKKQSQDDIIGSILMAGGQALQQQKGMYLGPRTPAQMSGVQVDPGG